MARDYSKYTTRALLSMRHYISNEYYEYYLDNNDRIAFDADQEALYAELARREHVPNKEESRASRKEQAEMHRKSKKELAFTRKGRNDKRR